MKKTEQTGSTVSDFFKGIPEQAPVTDSTETLFSPEDFSEMMMEAVYILDFQKRNFCHVADHDFFLCGHSREDALNAGYEFFRKVIHPEDVLLWAKMHSVILKYLIEPDLQADSVNYFSCTFRIKSSFQTGNKSNYLMAYQKLKPKWQDGQLQFGICLLSSSIIRQAGNLRLCYKNSLDYDEYSFQNRKWKRQKMPKLNDRQKEILKLGKQGKNSRQMADIMCVSLKAIEKTKTSVFEKFGVNSIEQAVIYASNRQLIFSNTLLKQEKQLIIKQTHKHILTSDVLKRIQIGLEQGQSVYSLAKKEGFTEGSLRYAIRQGRLSKRIINSQENK
jgi:DNA-binding CsgD family transcriptional regulator